MPTYLKDVQALRKPDNIRDAVFASSPYVLRKAFVADPAVRRLVRAGPEVVADIAKELGPGALELPDITLACLAHILSEVEPDRGTKLLAPLLRRALEKPGGPFFPHFATHLLRQQARLPVRPLEMVYRREEMAEALGRYQ
jgi:hypothetical protein